MDEVLESKSIFGVSAIFGEEVLEPPSANFVDENTSMNDVIFS